MIVILVIV